MQTATQSYAVQMYSQVQTRDSSSSPVNKKNSNPLQTPSSEDSPKSSSQDSLSLSAAGKEISKKQLNASANQEKGTNQKPLTDAELTTLTELKQRDTEVRTHEQAHLSAAGAYAAGGASFSYTTGPNGKRYAVGGEVPIDISKEDTPAATILKMQTVRRAALAPANPSSTDRAVAAQASAKEAQARKELQTAENVEQQTSTTQETDTNDTTGTERSEAAPQPSASSRIRMTSAYQAIAALAT